MRVAIIGGAILASVLASRPASAATIVVYTHPETLQRTMVVVDSRGPDRMYLCMLPPGEAGCQRVPMKRAG